MYQLPLHWHESGHQVEIGLLDYRGLRTESTTIDGFAVNSLPMRDPRSLWRLRAGVKRFQPDAIVASGDCFVGLAGLRLARLVAARFVFDVYDDYTAFGSYRAFAGWDALGHLLGGADVVLYASQAMAQRHPAASPWLLVPNGVDPSVFAPSSMASARARVGLDIAATRLIGYFGSMEPDRGVDDLISAVGQLHAADPSIRLLLCGTPRQGMDAFPAWVDYHGVVAHADMPAYLNSCDVLVVPYRRSQVMDMGASCKIAEYMYCQRPLVATDTPNLSANFPIQADQLADALCAPGDPVDLARALEIQLTRPRLVALPIEHSWQVIAERTLEALRN